MLLVNHQIRTEASDVFYNEGRIVVEISERRLAFLSSVTDTQNYALFKTPKMTPKIKHVIVEICVDVTNTDARSAHLNDQLPWIPDNMRSFCHALSMKSILRTLEVTCWHYNTISDS